jgi:hypothetical protein
MRPASCRPLLAALALAAAGASADPVTYAYQGTVASAVTPPGSALAPGTPVTGTFTLDYANAIATDGSGSPGSAPFTAAAFGGSAFGLPVPGFVFAFTATVAGAPALSYASVSEPYDDSSSVASNGTAFAASAYSAPAAGVDTGGGALAITPPFGLSAYSATGYPLWTSASSGTLDYAFDCAAGFLCEVNVALASVALASDAPEVVPDVTGTPGANGWYVSAVTVAWAVFGVPTPTTSGCATTPVHDTRGSTFSCTATNDLGSASGSVTIREDTVAPKVTLRAPRNGARYAQNARVVADFSCADALSGVAGCVGTLPDGSVVPTATKGSHGFVVVGTDNAGNVTTVTASYLVE